MKLAELIARCEHNEKSTLVLIDGARRRSSVSYARLAELAKARAGELSEIGVQRGHVIGIQAKNTIDWVVWDLATLATGAILQAFPDEMPIGDTDELLCTHGLALLVADTAGTEDHASAVTPDQSVSDRRISDHARVLDLPDVHSLVYSSGTSGKLKGLRISAKGTEYVIMRFLEAFPISDRDCHLIFLSLANYQQRLSLYCCLWTGADLVLAPYQRVFAAAASEKPTFMIAPPVFYDAALQLFSKTGGGRSLSEFLGGRISFMITGMAPIRRRTLTAFWGEGIRLLEAYGMTECGMISWNTPDAYRVGTVGRLLDPDAVTILDDGELIIHRAYPLSQDYFEAEADVRNETFRADGSIATGDFGELAADGFLTLLGRKKDVIALGSGRKIHPAELETVLGAIDGIEEVVVVPTPQSNRLGALVLPAEGLGGNGGAEIRERIAGANQDLDPYQRITSVVLIEQSLLSDPRFLTKNMKLSRPAAARYFAEVYATDHDKPAAGMLVDDVWSE